MDASELTGAAGFNNHPSPVPLLPEIGATKAPTSLTLKAIKTQVVVLIIVVIFF
jgi:hypothetical protein